MSVWENVVGQKAAVQAFQTAALSARRLINLIDQKYDITAGKNSTDSVSNQSESAWSETRAMSHAWLVTGPPGSGRSTACLAFAAALQCEDPTALGCGKCPACQSVLSRSHADVKILSTERVIIKMEEVEQLVSLSQQAPSVGYWRVIMIEDADRMVERTSNLLLKAIEEPPPRTVWLLCAPQPQDVLNTIRSRCRLVNLTTPSVSEVAQLLVKQSGVDPTQAKVAAALAQCHIGLARHLAKDPQAITQRRELIQPILTSDTLSKAMYAADFLLTEAKKRAEEQTRQRNEVEEAELRKALGIEPKPARIPPQLRPQFTALAEDQKRRATRALRDAIDRVLLDLLGYYRDVYLTQVKAEQELINLDLATPIRQLALSSTPAETISRIDAVRTARKRLAANVAPLLALEAMMMVLKTQ